MYVCMYVYIYIYISCYTGFPSAVEDGRVRQPRVPDLFVDLTNHNLHPKHNN